MLLRHKADAGTRDLEGNTAAMLTTHPFIKQILMKRPPNPQPSDPSRCYACYPPSLPRVLLNRTSYPGLKEGSAQQPRAFDMMMLMSGITRTILRCYDAVAMRSCTDLSIRPIRISRIGSDQIVHDGIPLHLHCIPNERNRFR